MLEELRDWQPPQDEKDAAEFRARQDEQQLKLETIAAKFNQLLAEWQANTPHDPQETLRVGEQARATNELIAKSLQRSQQPTTPPALPWKTFNNSSRNCGKGAAVLQATRAGVATAQA